MERSVQLNPDAANPARVKQSRSCCSNHGESTHETTAKVILHIRLPYISIHFLLYWCHGHGHPRPPSSSKPGKRRSRKLPGSKAKVLWI